MPTDALLPILSSLCGLLDDSTRRVLADHLNAVAGPAPDPWQCLDVDAVITALEDDPGAVFRHWDHTLTVAAYDLDGLAAALAAADDF